MVNTYSTTAEITQTYSKKEIKELTISEEILRINKVKYNLGVLYFVSLTVILTSLFI